MEPLCDVAGGSLAEAAANMDRGSVPSSMELRGSAGAEDEEDEEEEVLPLRVPRRVFVSVTWAGRKGSTLSPVPCSFSENIVAITTGWIVQIMS